MKNLFLAVFSLGLFIQFCNGQSKDLSQIDEVKIQLENLQKQIWEVDFKQRKEISDLEGNSEVKGEFETTKQFDDRKSKIYDQTSQLSLEIREQSGNERNKIQRRLGEILAIEFEGKINISFGQYNADAQIFPVFLQGGLSFETLTVSLNEAKELKENIQESKITGKLSLILDKNNKAQLLLNSADINYKGKNYRTTSNFSSTTALELVYGNYDVVTKTSAWTTYETEDFENYSLMKMSASVLLFKQFQEDGIQKYLLVTQTEKSNGGCHACGAILGIAIFTKKDAFWKIDSTLKNAGEQGRFGNLDQPSLAKIGKDKYALKFSWSDMHQGNVDGGDYYISLENKVFNEILSYSTIETSYNDGVVTEYDVSTNSKVFFIQGENPNYLDVKVVTVGKKAVKVSKRYYLKPYTNTDLYKYKDGKYKLVK